MSRLHHHPLKVLLLAALIGSVTSLASAQGPAKRLATPADLVDVREAADAAISRDGRLVAFVVTEPAIGKGQTRGDENVWTVPADGSGEARPFAATAAREMAPAWSPDGRTLAFLSDAGKKGAQIWLQAVGGGTARQLTASPSAISRFRWSPDGAAIAFVAVPPAGEKTAQPAGRPTDATVVGRAGTPGRVAQLWEVAVADGQIRGVTGQAFAIRDFAWSPKGDAFAVLTDPNRADPGGGKRVLVVDRRTGDALRTLSNRADGPGTRTQILDWSPDGTTVAFAYAEPNVIGSWIGVTPAAGGPTRQLLKAHDGTVMRAMWAGDSRHLVAQVFEGTRSVLRRVDVTTGQTTVVGETLDAYPDFAADASGNVLAHVSGAPHAPGDVWVQSAAGKKQLTRLHPQMTQVMLGDVRAIEWKSKTDGETIRGVLVTPPGYQPDRAYPTVVLIHGGPHFHWHSGWLGAWDDWAQLLASNGYVALLPNPRGSTGRTIEFEGAIRKDIGGIDLKDILDGTEAILERGIADPARLGVGGWSYGGFMTAWTITQTRRFKAAVVGAGISDLASFAGTPGNGPGWQSFFPDVFVRQPAEYDRRSAVRNLQGVTTATLIAHGERDSKISVTQAWELYYGLNTLKVPVELIVYPREGHGFTEREHRLHLMENVLGWFNRHLTPAASSSGGSGGR